FRLLGVFLLLAGTLVADTPPIDGTISTTGGSATPGSTFFIPVTISLNAGKTVDTLSFGVSIEAVGSAPAFRSTLDFVPDSSLPKPSQVDKAQAGTIAVAWL